MQRKGPVQENHAAQEALGSSPGGSPREEPARNLPASLCKRTPKVSGFRSPARAGGPPAPPLLRRPGQEGRPRACPGGLFFRPRIPPTLSPVSRREHLRTFGIPDLPARLANSAPAGEAAPFGAGAPSNRPLRGKEHGGLQTGRQAGRPAGRQASSPGRLRAASKFPPGRPEQSHPQERPGGEGAPRPTPDAPARFLPPPRVPGPDERSLSCQVGEGLLCAPSPRRRRPQQRRRHPLSSAPPSPASAARS